jgi:hypothetical protein
VFAESVAYLGHPNDTVAVPKEVLPAVDSRGRFYLVDASGGQVIAFRPDGRLLTSFGKAGMGPGEFARIRVIVATSGDTLLVFGNRTVHVVSPGYEHVRQFSDSMATSAGIDHAVLRDGRILRGVSDVRGFALLHPDGVLEPPVVLRDIDTTFACGDCRERVFRESYAGGSVWSGTMNRYVLEEHKVDGTFVRRFIREVEWFKPWGKEPQAGGGDDIDELSVFRFLGAGQNPDGIVWTHSAGIENPDEVRRMMAATDPASGFDEERLFGLMTTHIEAIDPESGKLLGGMTVPGLALPLNHEFSGQIIIDDSGGWAWKIFRLRVDGR